MTLIDRYLYQVGRRLPGNQRDDILAELRSSLTDSVEDRYGPNPTEAEVAELLNEFGPPDEVAASYHPRGQYLIGPTLYPLFKLVASIALVAVIGAQVLAWIVAIFIANEPFQPLDALAGLVNSIPISIGMVVIVFAVLQRFGVQPEQEDEDWIPSELPPIEPSREVNRTEKFFEIGFSILILVILLVFPQWIGFWSIPTGEFFDNPVILRYLGWISFSLLIGIALDIYLLWEGRWQTGTRLAKLAVNLLSLAILALLIQGHTAWLAERGASSFIVSLQMLEQSLAEGTQLVGMQAFRLGFVVAAIVITIESLSLIYRMVRGQKVDTYPAEIAAENSN